MGEMDNFKIGRIFLRSFVLITEPGLETLRLPVLEFESGFGRIGTG